MSSTRDTAFIPLSSAAPATQPNGDYKLTVLSSPDKAQPFRPLGQSPAAAPTSAHQSNCEPRVTVQREGDRVSGIQVHCSCGQVIELACVY
ncbi:MAG: hypothetical protein H7Y43_10615 [Akkermansiaceae bacterium]|nr:hypothetical protein [Verrucomicrobiales bacterium]